MEEKRIKEILSEDLKQISNENFNEKILNQIAINVEQKKETLFKEGEIVKIFVFIFLLILFLNIEFSQKLNQTTILVGSILCFTPVLLIFYNKIYQLTVKY